MYDKTVENTSPSLLRQGSAGQGNPFLEAALQYAGRGWKVFPLKPRGKTPLVKGGFKAATTNPEQIAKWWGKWPQANVGIATGQASGLIVLDIDGQEGLLTIGRLLSLYGRLPNTAVVRTARGAHIYLKGNLHCKCSSADGLDVRGDGGYVVAPPSVHETGIVYSWERLP